MIVSSKSDYSAKELKLVEHYGFENILKHIEVSAIYRMMVEKSFSMGENNKYSDSLRRCYNAFGKIYRGTKEFDDLIDLD